MRNLWRGLAVLIAALAATAVATSTAGADAVLQGAREATDVSVTSLLGPQVPLTQSYSQTLQGDYVAAGVGMRNVGGGTISIALPAGSTIERAFLYWSLVRPAGPAAPNTGTLNGTAIVGTAIGTSGSPCWIAGDALIDNYRADVTAIAVDGVNTLTAFPSGATDNSHPTTNTTPPLLEGATLVVVFENAGYDFNTVVVRNGAQTFAGQSVATPFGMFTAAPGNATDQAAQTTYVVADGQANAPSDRASFNGTFVAGPGTAVKTVDAFNGADGIVPVSASHGLWDTLNLDVSTFFPPGVATAATTDVDASLSADCLTYVAQVLSVKTTLNLEGQLDIKPGSFPNSIKLTNNGVIPVALLGSASFDVTDVDWSTVAFAGDTTEAHGKVHYSDVNGDGFLDAVLHYETQQTNIAPGDTEACLTGQLTNSVAFVACDSVRTIP
jgi:hypothetical protein